jgi:predicted lipoprotein
MVSVSLTPQTEQRFKVIADSEKSCVHPLGLLPADGAKVITPFVQKKAGVYKEVQAAANARQQNSRQLPDRGASNGWAG